MRIDRPMSPLNRLTRIVACAVAIFCCALPMLVAGEKGPEKPLTEEEKKKAEEELKKKIPPLKYDAWCVFSKLSERRIRELDPESTHSRPNSIGLEGFGRRGKWAHVVLDLQNTTELKKKTVFEGTASIVFNQVQTSGVSGAVPYSTTYSQSFKIGPETENQYHFSILCPDYGWSPNVEVRIDCRSAGLIGLSRSFQLSDLDQAHEELIVVVSDTPGAFAYLGPNAKRRATVDGVTDDLSRPVSRQVASVIPAELPERWQDLSIASLIIIDGPPNEALNQAQWDALKTYAQSGGRILIMAGKDPNKLKGPIETLAGITVRGSAELPAIDQFDPPYKGPKKLNPEDPEWKMPVVEVSAPGAGVVKRNSKTQIVEYSARSYGAGLVAFVPYSLTDKLLEHWHGRSTIPLGLLSKDKNLFSIDTDQEDDTVQQNNTFSFFQNTIKPINNKTLTTFRSRLDKSFEDDTPVVMQSPNTVLRFLMLYLACAVPLNYLLFTLLKRREAAWLATPLIALGFTIAAYYISYSGQTGVTTVNQVTVLEAGPGQGEAVGRTFMGVYAPRRNTYHVAFPGTKFSNGDVFDYKAAPGHLVNQTYFDMRNVEFPEMEVYDTGARLDIDRILIQQRSTRRFEIQHRAPLGGGVDLKAGASTGAGGTDFAVTNNTGYTLINALFFKNDQFVLLKPKATGLHGTGTRFEPGEKFDSSVTPVQWRSGREQAFDELTSQLTRGKHTAERAQALTDYLESHSRQYAAGVMLAWIETPALPVAIGVSGSNSFDTPHIEGITLLVVPVAATNKGSRFGAAAFVPPRVEYATFYNPEVRESGEWKALKGKVAFEGTDQNNRACLYLRLTFDDNFSRSYYESKNTELSFTIDDTPAGQGDNSRYRGDFKVFARNDAALNAGQRFTEANAPNKSSERKNNQTMYKHVHMNFFKNLSGGSMIVKIVPMPASNSSFVQLEKLLLSNFRINLVEPKNNQGAQ